MILSNTATVEDVPIRRAYGWKGSWKDFHLPAVGCNTLESTTSFTLDLFHSGRWAPMFSQVLFSSDVLILFACPGCVAQAFLVHLLATRGAVQLAASSSQLNTLVGSKWAVLSVFPFFLSSWRVRAPLLKHVFSCTISGLLQVRLSLSKINPWIWIYRTAF